MNYVTVSQLRNLIPNIKIIDIRDNYQYNLENIPTSKNIPANFLITNPENYLNHYDNYYIYCQFGNTSKKVCNILRNKGYKAIDVLGGYNEYKKM